MKIAKTPVLRIVALALGISFFDGNAHASGFFGGSNGNWNGGQQNVGILPPSIPGVMGSMSAYMSCTEGLAKSTNPKDFSKIEQCLMNAEKPQLNFQKQLSISSANTWCNQGFQQNMRLAGADLARVNNMCSLLNSGGYAQAPFGAQQQFGSILPPAIPSRISSISAYMTCSQGLAKSTNLKDFPKIEQCLLNAEKPQLNFQKELSIIAPSTWCNQAFQQNMRLAGNDLNRVMSVCSVLNSGTLDGYGQTRLMPVLPQPIPGTIGAARSYMVCSERLARSTNPKDFAEVEQCLFNAESPQPNFRKQLSMTAVNTWCNLAFQDRLKLSDADLDRTDRVCQAIGIPLPDVCPYDNGNGASYGQTSFGGQQQSYGGILPVSIPGKLSSMNAYMTCSQSLAKSTNPKDFSKIEQCLLNAEKPQVNFQKQLSLSAPNTWCNPGFQQGIGLSGGDFNRVGKVCSYLNSNSSNNSYGNNSVDGGYSPVNNNSYNDYGNNGNYSQQNNSGNWN